MTASSAAAGCFCATKVECRTRVVGNIVINPPWPNVAGGEASDAAANRFAATSRG